MKTPHFALPLIFGFFAISFVHQNTCAADKVVATVGAKAIYLSEFNRRYNEVLKQTINPPSKEVFLEDLIRYKIGLQEAHKKNLQKKPAVQERMNQELYKALIEEALGKQVAAIKVQENEMKSLYKKFPELRTSHILIAVAPDAPNKKISAAQKRATDVYRDVRKGKKSFKDFVNLYSDDEASKKSGGDFGWQTHLHLPPNYYKQALSMKVGQIKGPVRTQFGFHIIKLTGKRPYSEANKRSIHAAVFDQKRKELFDRYFSSLKKKYKIRKVKGSFD